MRQKTTRDALTTAAAGVFARSGFDRARISDVAREAGVAQGTVYLHVTGKDQLLELAATRVADRLRALAGGVDWTTLTTFDEFRARYAQLYAAVFACIADDPDGATLLLLTPASTSAAVAATRASLLADAEAITADYLAEGVARGFTRPLPIATIARAIVGLVLHTAEYTVLLEGRRDGFEELAAELIDFELEGCAARPPGAENAAPAPPVRAINGPVAQARRPEVDGR